MLTAKRFPIRWIVLGTLLAVALPAMALLAMALPAALVAAPGPTLNATQVQIVDARPDGLDYVPGEVLVAYRAGAIAGTLGAGAAPLAASSRTLGQGHGGKAYARLRLRAGLSVPDAVQALQRDPNVVAVSPNYLRRTLLLPNDTHFAATPNRMWGMHDTGQNLSGLAPPYPTNAADPTPDNDVDAPEAWDLVTGSPTVVVAVIDSGVDYTHPDLAGAMWDATSATFGGSPLGSPNHGYDFAMDDSDPYPTRDSHGTHVAGTIGASGNDGFGVPGMAYGVQIMALKIMPDLFDGLPDSATIAAINYARENGAHVINMSLGGENPENTVFTTAMQDAVAAGVLVVVAAGNGGADGVGDNNDAINMYPANYAGDVRVNSAVIAVMATDQADLRASFSNYGATNVTLGAPGVNITSTVPGRATAQAETGAAITEGASAICFGNTTLCMDGTIFDAAPSVDCVGALCTWAWWKTGGVWWMLGTDLNAGTYDNNTDGTITTQAVNVSTAQRVVLDYWAVWDLECDWDYVDVQVWNGAAWQTLRADFWNVTGAGAACTSTRTHTGRLATAQGDTQTRRMTYDLTPYANAGLRVRFHFVTDTTVNPTAIPYAFQLAGLSVNTEALDYSGAFDMWNGTSMATPLVAGIAALVKSRNPAYTGADLRQALVNSVDPVAGYGTLVSSGGRANAYNAVRYIQPPSGVTALR